MIKNNLRALVASFVFVLSFAVVSNFAQTSPSPVGNVKIRNFGQMDDHYYRGAQPKEDEYQSLKDLGVKTVIDLQEKPTKYEKAAVEALGMTYVNIPMDDTEYPKPEAIETFLKIVNDPATGTVFVHCKGGKHRTGVTGAVYRFTKYGWDYDKAYQEMLNYDFYTKWGRQVMKDFVVDYAAKMQAAKTQSTTAQTATN
ncbi:MAG TPA: tyrosine-protein phosphatase [Pyrinomonadaceae bacterium]|jgi:protein tyrosine/serine phosphatase|nr:tyrosine-protein phosphatase [Pyrinomonadaceae bacterium]